MNRRLLTPRVAAEIALYSFNSFITAKLLRSFDPYLRKKRLKMVQLQPKYRL